jgi:hypothetical protein
MSHESSVICPCHLSVCMRPPRPLGPRGLWRGGVRKGRERGREAARTLLAGWRHCGRTVRRHATDRLQQTVRCNRPSATDRPLQHTVSSHAHSQVFRHPDSQKNDDNEWVAKALCVRQRLFLRHKTSLSPTISLSQSITRRVTNVVSSVVVQTHTHTHTDTHTHTHTHTHTWVETRLVTKDDGEGGWRQQADCVM